MTRRPIQITCVSDYGLRKRLTASSHESFVRDNWSRISTLSKSNREIKSINCIITISLRNYIKPNCVFVDPVGKLWLSKKTDVLNKNHQNIHKQNTFKTQPSSTISNGVVTSHTTAYNISVCERMLIRSHTVAYANIRWGTLGLSRCTFCYTQRLNYGVYMFKMYQRTREYSIYVTHTLQHARHTLDTQDLHLIN